MRLRNQLRSLRTFERQGEALPTPVFPELLLSDYIRSICEARRVGSERGRKSALEQFACSSVRSALSARNWLDVLEQRRRNCVADVILLPGTPKLAWRGVSG
jgi:hypothetical protein